MAGSTPMDLGDLGEWLEALGLAPSEGPRLSSDEESARAGLRDGTALCRLVNKIKPGSIDQIKPKRSSGDAEENILRFLQACTTLGVTKIFRPSDLLDKQKDFVRVLVTLQQLYNKAAALGMGVQFSRLPPTKPQQNGMSGAVTGGGVTGGGVTGGGLSGNTSPLTDEMDNEEGEEMETVVKAVYSFQGSSEDELQFEKGDIIMVTKMVDGGWWEGTCNGRLGWFPGNYAEVVEDAKKGEEEDEDSPQHYHKLVVKNILDTERVYVQDLQSLLSNYLVPLRSTNVVSTREVEYLTGNLSELVRWQESFFNSIEGCSKLPVPRQNLGSIFQSVSAEIEVLYTSYCANHPRAVAVLTENSDKLSAFMESKGAASPGLLTLTSNLSKPFRRLEKYTALLKELKRHLIEGHADEEHVHTAIDTYNGISIRTQDVRKRREMEHEMLSNPVKGFGGQCLNELGECQCVLQASQALGSAEVEERFFLVFPSCFVILAVGQSLSGYELKANFPLSSVVVKRAVHSEQWPFAVEVAHKQETVLASLASERDLDTLVDSLGAHEAAVTRAPQRPGSVGGSRTVSMAATRPSSVFRSAPARAMRHNAAPIKRAHVWGFKSLRPLPPLRPQQLAPQKEIKSPKGAKKFIYPVAKKKRSSKALEEVFSTSGNRASPHPVDKPGDRVVLSVVEAYCAVGKGLPFVSLDKAPVTTEITATQLTRSRSIGARSPQSRRHTGRTPHAFSSVFDDSVLREAAEPSSPGSGRSATLPHASRYQQSSPLPSPIHGRRGELPLYRPPSPLLIADYNYEPVGPSRGPPDRRRAESVGSFARFRVKDTTL